MPSAQRTRHALHLHPPMSLLVAEHSSTGQAIRSAAPQRSRARCALTPPVIASLQTWPSLIVLRVYEGIQYDGKPHSVAQTHTHIGDVALQQSCSGTLPTVPPTSKTPLQLISTVRDGRPMVQIGGLMSVHCTLEKENAEENDLEEFWIYLI